MTLGSCRSAGFALSLTAAFLTMGVVATAAAEKNFSRRLDGAAAVQFLIGNSLREFFEDESDDRVNYFISEAAAMSGYQSGKQCFVNPWKFSNGLDCSSHASLKPGDEGRCSKFYVLTADVSPGTAPKRGDLIGYYLNGDDPNQAGEKGSLAQRFRQAIFAGNATHCPLVSFPIRTQPLMLATGDKSVPNESVQTKPDENGLPDKIGTPGMVLERLLIGNSIIWPGADGQACGHIHYFGRDGLIYKLECEDKNVTVPLEYEVEPLRWKNTDKGFCIEDVSDNGDFDACDSIRLTVVTAPAKSGEAPVRQLRATYIDDVPDLIEQGPGLVVQGNPAQFSLDDRRAKGH